MLPPMKSAINTIKLLALDLDDTLLNHDHIITDENRRALMAAEERGVHVVLASGRTPKAMIPYARELGMDRREGLLIAYNGASIRDCASLREEWGIRLDRQVCAELYAWCASEGIALQTYVDDAILVNVNNEYSRLDSELTGMPNILVDQVGFAAQERVKCLIPGDPAIIQTILPRISEAFKGRAVFFTSKPYFLEVMPPGADKGIALARLADIHGYRREEVMAMGDAMNDFGMVKWAGAGIAMANGRDELKAVAAWVTTRNNHESGVAEAVERFILNA